MGATYYRAESESGDHVEDPSEDALFMLIDDLNDSDNTFVVIQPDEAEDTGRPRRGTGAVTTLHPPARGGTRRQPLPGSALCGAVKVSPSSSAA